MARNNLDDNSAHALINVFPYGNTEFSFRLKNGELMSHFPGNSVEFPNVKLKLERKENNFTGSIFLNDVWEDLGTITLDGIGDKMFIGLATLSHDNE